LTNDIVSCKQRNADILKLDLSWDRLIAEKEHMENKAEKGDWIYGRRPVAEVFGAARRHVHELLVVEEGRETPELTQLRAAAARAGAPVRKVSRRDLDDLTQNGHHQGVAVRTGGFPYVCVEEVAGMVEKRKDALVLILDHLEDPQNLGSLLRTADAAGVHAVVIPEDRAVGVTPAVVRASAGASEHMRVARVVNLVRAMEMLKKAGLWTVGLDMEGDDVQPYTAIDFKDRIGIVIGSEGHGLKRLTRETCDFIARLPMAGQVASLNAAVAGAICLYEAVRQRQGSTKN
jgi:23S rRNA (guanosine2251-2'-O)-methyltransferase